MKRWSRPAFAPTALQHIYAELRLPFDAALDAAEADLLREQNEGPKEAARRSGTIP